MGLILCPTHGRNSVWLVCRHLRDSVATKTPIGSVVRFGDEHIEKQIWRFNFCGDCATSIDLDETRLEDGGYWLSQIEDLALDVVCPHCFLDLCNDYPEIAPDFER